MWPTLYTSKTLDKWLSQRMKIKWIIERTGFVRVKHNMLNIQVNLSRAFSLLAVEFFATRHSVISTASH